MGIIDFPVKRTPKDFVDNVLEMSKTESIIILYQEGLGPFAAEHKIWPEIRFESFRCAVVDILYINKEVFNSYYFCPPDYYDDGWGFVAYVRKNK